MSQTLSFPEQSIRCLPGDYLLQTQANGVVRIYRVDDLVKLSRLVPWGDDAVIEEGTLLDSEPPRYGDEIYLLLTAFGRGYASLDEATQAVEAGTLGSGTAGQCLDIRRFPVADSRLYRLPAAQ